MLAAFLAVVSTHLLAQGARETGPGRTGGPPLLGATTIPAGWQARLDRPTDLITNLTFVAIRTGLHFTTGPAGAFYQPSSLAKGAYQVRAGFTQTKPSNYPEGYGLFIGGADLQGPNQQYTYFLVRQDGRYIIKRRIGAETKTIQDWTANATIVKPNTQGQSDNVLSVVVGPTVRFIVNGTEVSTQPRAAIDTEGVAGLRVNHNLDLHVEGFTVTIQKREAQ